MLKIFTLLVLFPAGLLVTFQPDSLKLRLRLTEGNEKLEIHQTLSRHYLLGSLDSCEKYSAATIRLAPQLNDKENEAPANKRLGYAFYRTGDYNKGLTHFEKAIGLL